MDGGDRGDERVDEGGEWCRMRCVLGRNRIRRENNLGVLD